MSDTVASTNVRRLSLGNTPPSCSVRAYDVLTAAGVPCSLILDSAVAYVMDKIDLVLLGSEAVAESGGLINAVGSYQMAIVTKAANKPLYALAERSVSFVLLTAPIMPK